MQCIRFSLEGCVYRMGKRTLSVRLEDELYTKVHTDKHGAAYVVYTALQQYYGVVYSGPEPSTNVYNAELVDLLKQQIADLRQDKLLLQDQVRYKDELLMLRAAGPLGRLKLLLSAHART